MCAIALMTGLYAVAVSPGSQINDIKLSGYYFYAESTDPVEENARKAADTFLASYIRRRNHYGNDVPTAVVQDRKSVV